MSHPESKQDDPGYEKQDANVRAIVVTAIVSVLVLVVVVLALDRYFVVTQEEIYQEQVLRTVPHELLELRRVEDSVLNSYELLDSLTKTYRVPIDRAMDIIVEEAPGTSVPE